MNGNGDFDRHLYYFYAVPKRTEITRETDIWGIWAKDQEEAKQRMRSQILGCLSDLYDCVPKLDKIEDNHFFKGILF